MVYRVPSAIQRDIVASPQPQSFVHNIEDSSQKEARKR